MVKENLRTKTLRLPNNERIQYTYTSIKLCVRITIQNGSLKALNSKNTSCVNTNHTTISDVAQCTLFRKLDNNKGCTEVVLKHS